MILIIYFMFAFNSQASICTFFMQWLQSGMIAFEKKAENNLNLEIC